MTRREQWRRVLDIEVQRWSAMTPEQLASFLNKEQVYEVELDSKRYQVEIEMLQRTEEYFHAMVAVDDGSLPASIVPETQTFICNKKFRNL
jgi:DNA relaxase NicK